MLLLDTHVWLWFANDDVPRISGRAARTVRRAQASDAVRISPASIFEVAALHVHGRLRLSRTPERWIDEALTVPGVRVAELTPDIAVEAGLIPRSALSDPMDRFLVATARSLDATLLTADRRILDYAADTHHVRVQDVAR